MSDFPGDPVFVVFSDFSIDRAGQKRAEKVAGEVDSGGGPGVAKQSRRRLAEVETVGGDDSAHGARRIHTGASYGAKGVQRYGHC